MVNLTTKDVGKERREKKLKKRLATSAKDPKLGITTTTEPATAELVIRTAPKPKGPIAKVTKSSATTNRISREQKVALAESGKAVYVALPKSLKKRRSAAHTSLKSFLSGLQLRGLKAAAPSGTSFFALMFDTEDRRDRAVNKILRSTFRWEGVAFRLIAHNFGDNGKGKQVIWQLSANLLASGEEVRESIIEHVLQIDPPHTSPFEVRQIIDNDMPTDKELGAEVITGVTGITASKEITVMEE
ncbi:hypothetical protein FRX31_032725 [Thalictrum thalictroides]|uniref:Uncharacterized protein n=1 Tax=Thalictrum thalictroides TaxID=46969 RepID=A0A7J6UYI7_THATH|nr:hypothetical protein FRX31_032725 [Thalictrum thalictroides]